MICTLCHTAFAFGADVTKDGYSLYKRRSSLSFSTDEDLRVTLPTSPDPFYKVYLSFGYPVPMSTGKVANSYFCGEFRDLAQIGKQSVDMEAFVQQLPKHIVRMTSSYPSPALIGQALRMNLNAMAQKPQPRSRIYRKDIDIMTNYQWIRQMNADQLAEFLNSFTQDETPWDIVMNDQYCRNCYAADSEETLCAAGGQCPFFPDAPESGTPSSKAVCKWWLQQDSTRTDDMPNLPSASQMLEVAQQRRAEYDKQTWEKIGNCIIAAANNGAYNIKINIELFDETAIKSIIGRLATVGYQSFATKSPIFDPDSNQTCMSYTLNVWWYSNERNNSNN